MAVIPIRESKSKGKTKLVLATEKHITSLPFNSGMWKVEGTPGLYVRCRAQSKSYWLQRRVGGELVKEMLGQVSLKQAKEQAAKLWGTVEPKDPNAKVLTLGQAIEDYIEAKTAAGKMAPKTAVLARYNADRYLKKWKDRTLDEVGNSRLEVRQLQQFLTKKYRASTSNQVVRLLSCVYRWCRKVDVSLPESPMVVAEIQVVKPRDWAYSPDELKAWWHSSVVEDKKIGKVRELGVSTLGTLKRTWWLCALLTGARKGSIEALKWTDVDLDKRVIYFKITKGDRPYAVPMSDALAELLTRYKKSEDVPPSEAGWVFPSPNIENAHLVDVKDPKSGVGPAHRLRHSYRTVLAQLGASPDQARLLLGHSMGGDVSSRYVTSSLVMESLRPLANAVSNHYRAIIPKAFEIFGPQ